MSTLRERNRDRTRVEIAEAALELFEAKGYEAVTVDEVCVAAGISSATFFRYFRSKEDVLFTHEDEAAEELVSRVRAREDRSPTVAALAAPVGAYADCLSDGSIPLATRLVMTTRTLEARSLRMRLRWEHAVALELAREGELAQPGLTQTTTAAIAVSCLTSALRHWDHASGDLGALVAEAFQLCGSAQPPAGG